MAPIDTKNPTPQRPRGYLRRQYVVNAAFQWKYTLTLSSTVFILALGLSTVLYGVLHQQARLRAMDPVGYTAEVGGVMLLFGGGFALLAAVGLGVWSMVMTHRICGPLFVLGRYFKDIQKGIIPTPRPLRRKDEFKELFADFCKGTQALRTRAQSDLATLTEAEVLAKSAERGDAEACGQALDAIATRLAELRKRAAESLGEEVDEIACDNRVGLAEVGVS